MDARSFTGVGSLYYLFILLEVINANTYLRLNNVERSFAYPCTIDIKLGRQTYGPGATEAKKKSGRHGSRLGEVSTAAASNV